MGKYAYLLKVEPQANNNKYYEMSENADGQTFTATFGRVDSTPQKKQYSIHEWDRIYKSKVGDRKGYMDVTKYKAVVTEVTHDDTVRHKSPIISSIFNHFQSAAKGIVKRNYNVTAVGVVTQNMLDDAQDILNILSENIDCGEWARFNKNLTSLFHVIPRKMEKVQWYILDLNETTNIINRAKELLTNEQSLLDTLGSQVYINSFDVTNIHRPNLFDVLGVAVDECTATELAAIKSKMGNDVNRFDSAIKVTHFETHTRYNTAACKYQPSNARLEWHGSRTENWLNILRTGLVLHPTNAYITGKMFGHGLYFAPKAGKSIGYTSSRGSYWVNGQDQYGYLGMFNIQLGRTMDVQRHRREYEQYTYAKIQSLGYDSLYAHGGYDLKNDEIIVYSPDQATVSYIVRIK